MSGEGVLLGIDLGGTNCRGALVSPAGAVRGVRRMATRIDRGLPDFWSRLVMFCRQFRAEASADGDRLLALGIGVPGVIAADGSVRISPNLTPLNTLPLATNLAAELALPVTAVNDANAIAWGEALFGAGGDFSSFLTVTLGTGVGGGLVFNRSLWEGADGAAGEVGHLCVTPQGRLCGCGSRGCLEQYASASGVVRTVAELLGAGGQSVLSDLPGQELNSQIVAQAARNGDGLALAAFALAGEKLGVALAGIANLLNLEGVVVTGGAAESFDLMLPSLHAALSSHAFAIPARRLHIVRGTLGDDAGILGAARLAWDRSERA